MLISFFFFLCMETAHVIGIETLDLYERRMSAWATAVI